MGIIAFTSPLGQVDFTAWTKKTQSADFMEMYKILMLLILAQDKNFRISRTKKEIQALSQLFDRDKNFKSFSSSSWVPR